MAFAESVIHECGRFVAGSYEGPATELIKRSVVRFCCERRKTLVLADLSGAALKAAGATGHVEVCSIPGWARLQALGGPAGHNRVKVLDRFA